MWLSLSLTRLHILCKYVNSCGLCFDVGLGGGSSRWFWGDQRLRGGCWGGFQFLDDGRVSTLPPFYQDILASTRSAVSLGAERWMRARTQSYGRIIKLYTDFIVWQDALDVKHVVVIILE